MGSKKYLEILGWGWLHVSDLFSSLRKASLSAIFLIHLQGYLDIVYYHLSAPIGVSRRPFTTRGILALLHYREHLDVNILFALLQLLHAFGAAKYARTQDGLPVVCSPAWAYSGVICLWPMAFLWASPRPWGPRPFGQAFERGFTFKRPMS